MPSTRSILIAGSVALLALTDGVGAQGADPEPGLGFGTRFLVALVVYLVLGGALVAIGPGFARDAVREINEDPGTAFVWGLVAGIGVPIALVAIGLTVIGLLVAIPGLVVLFCVGVVSTAVMVAWIGDLLTGADGEVGAGAVAAGAAVLAIPAAIPVLGDLITFFISLFALGVVSRGLYEAWRG